MKPLRTREVLAARGARLGPLRPSAPPAAPSEQIARGASAGASAVDGVGSGGSREAGAPARGRSQRRFALSRRRRP